MSIGVQRIEKRLAAFRDFVDMSDLENRPNEEKERCLLSRSLAAYAVRTIGNAPDDATAAKSVTDGYHDRGIDAIHFDVTSQELFIVQAKWSNSIGWKDCGEFVAGVEELVAPNWEAFQKNKKISSRRQEIELALHTSAKVVLVTVHHGPRDADPAGLRRVDTLAQQLDDGSGLATAVHWHQSDLLAALKNESEPAPIEATMYLSNWGQITAPFNAVYGRVQADAIAKLWRENPHLSHLNIREYARSSEVNKAIADTVRNEPSNFWYFNNGLTIICESIQPAVLGRLNPEQAVFRLAGISLVNGAQTTGILAEHLDEVPDADRPNLWIQLRAIAVGNDDESREFASRITRYTNLQNAVTQQDFAAMDPVQSRLAIDFAIADRRYTFKRGGDPDPVGAEGCTLREATIALACAHTDVWYPVQVKREISTLWDTSSHRYRSLFHENLAATTVWNAVIVMRQVDQTVKDLRKDDHHRAEMVANHLQRIVLHLVFQSDEISNWEHSDPNSLPSAAAKVCKEVFERVCSYLQQHHDREYLASLSKNIEKCRAMVDALSGRTVSGQDAQDLFSGLNQ